MACLSDIDLATLHKTRLEEKIKYKLSWYAPRHILMKHLKKVPMNEQTTTQVHQSVSWKSITTRDHDNRTHDVICENINCIDNEFRKDYFTSSTRRKRSGTWP